MIDRWSTRCHLSFFVAPLNSKPNTTKLFTPECRQIWVACRTNQFVKPKWALRWSQKRAQWSKMQHYGCLHQNRRRANTSCSKLRYSSMLLPEPCGAQQWQRQRTDANRRHAGKGAQLQHIQTCPKASTWMRKRSSQDRSCHKYQYTQLRSCTTAI